MADRSQPQTVQVHTTTRRIETDVNPQQGYVNPQQGYVNPQQGYVNPQQGYEGGVNTIFPEKGPSTPQVVAVVTGVPIGATLLVLAGLTLAGTLLGLAVTTPLFILFSPVLVPATIVIGLSVAGFLTSGACGVTALSSFSWVMNYIRQTQGTVPEQLEYAKHRMADVAGYVGQKTKDAGQKTKEVGQEIQIKAQDAKRTT